MNTFEITIQRLHNGSWPVIVRHQPGPIALTSWAQGAFDLDLQQLDQFLPTDRRYGALLGENIFRDQVRDAFTRAVSGAAAASELLRVWLIVEAEDLRSKHWEQLYAPFEGGRWDYLLLNQQTPFSLYLPSQIERRFPPIGRRDLRALLLVAGPEELKDDYQLARFDVPATVAALSASLGQIPHDILASPVEGAVGEPSLNALCEKLTTTPYTLLFIVCHGSYNKQNGETILFLPEDERRRPVAGSELLTRLGRLKNVHGLPHFTFLSTCESADPRAENGLGGLGQRLVRELGMPAVLAMTERISIQTANALATALCTRLEEHGEVDRALAEALTSLQARYDVTVPALFSRLGGRPLFSDALDRPLTANDIRYGLEKMGELIEERAPVLGEEFQSRSKEIQASLDVDPAALSPETRYEFENALATVNQLSNQAMEISFNALALGQKPPEYDPRCPFRGLYPFREEDKEFFFGRQGLIDELAIKLEKHPFLAVLGPSGCGKSSMVLAGLLPRLEVPVAYLTPGSDPLHSLESALQSLDPDMVLFVDQFEELFTLCSDRDMRQAFLEQLLGKTVEMRVVIAMRADFLGECTEYPDLRIEIEAHQALIGPMDAEELRRAMERQADIVGLRFEAGLGEQILDDVRGEPGAMPLLQHALLLLWQRRHSRWLRWEEYTAIGGIQEAITHTAEEVYAELSEHEKLRVRDIFIRLTRPPELERSKDGSRYTRRRIKLDELVPADSDRNATTFLVKRLADVRLVVTRQREDLNEVQVEVAHEALIQYWPRLRTWLEENRTDILLREALTQAAREWESLDRDAGALYRGARLAQASEWATEHSTDLNILEQDFLVASQEQAQQEQAARERQRNRVLISALVIAIVMTILGLLAFDRSQAATYAQRQAVAQASTATYAQGTAVFALQTAEARRKDAEFQSGLARSRQLAAQSQGILDKKLDLGLLLAFQGYLVSHTDEALSAMRAALNYNQQPYQLIYNDEPHDVPESIAVSPDGMMAAVGYADGAVVLLDLDSGNVLQTFNPEDGQAWALLFLPDNRLLVGVTGGRIFLWEHGEEMPQRSADVFEPVVALTYNKSEERVYSIDRDGNVSSWNMSDETSLWVNSQSSLVISAEFSRDGRYLAFERDGAIVVYSMMKDDVIFEQSANVLEVAINPDGSQVAAVGSSNYVSVWDIHTEEETRLPINPGIGPSDPDAVHLIYSPDGKFLALSGESSVRVWDTTTTGVVAPALLAGTTVSIGAVAFSPDSQALLGALSDGNFIRWELPTPSDRLDMATAAGSSIASLSSDGTMVAFSYGGLGQVRLWDMNIGGPPDGVLGGTQDLVIDAAFSPEGEALALISHPDGIRVWNLATGKPFGPLLRGKTRGQLGFDSSGFAIIFNYDNNSVEAMNAYTGARLSLPSLPAPLDNIQPVSSMDPQIAITSSISETRVIDILTGIVIGGIKESLEYSDVSAFVTTDSGGRFARMTGKTLTVWDVTSGSRIFERSLDELDNYFVVTQHGNPVVNMEFSRDGKYLMAQSWWTGNGYIWDAENGNVQKSLTDEFDATDFILSPNADKLIGFGKDGSLRAWSFPELTLLWNRSVNYTTKYDMLRFSNDGQQFVTVDEAGNAGLWDLETGARLPQKWNVHLAGVVDLSFDMNGRRLASAGADNTVAIWSTSTGDLESGPHQLAFPPAVVAFDDAGNRLAIGSSDGSLELWNLDTDGTLVKHQLLDSTIVAIKFHPTKSWLAIASSDGMVHIYDMNDWTQLASFNVDELTNELAWTEDGVALLIVGDHKLVKFDTEKRKLSSDIIGIQNELESVKSAGFNPNTQLPLIFDKESLFIRSADDGYPYGPAIHLENEIVLDAEMLPNNRILAILQNNKTKVTSIVTLTFEDWQTAICYSANRTFTSAERNEYQLNDYENLACDKSGR